MKYFRNKLSGLFYAALLVLSITSCAKEEKELSTEQLEVIAYFKDVALGFEFGSADRLTRKWKEPLDVFLTGNPSEELVAEFNRIKTEINALATDGFLIRQETDSLKANYVLVIGNADAYIARYPFVASYTPSNWGLFFVNWDGNQYLNSGHMYVDNERANLMAQKHLLREELTQSLGLARDALTYPESIFQANWTTVQEYAPIDRELIRLLYHPRMTAGLNELEVDELLTQILLEE